MKCIGVAFDGYDITAKCIINKTGVSFSSFAADDENITRFDEFGINKGIPEFEAALKKASIDYKLYIYAGAQHAFNNDTNTERYNKEAAQLAWGRTIAFFKEKLKT